MIQPFDEEEWVRISNLLHSATFGTIFLTVKLGHNAHLKLNQEGGRSPKGFWQECVGPYGGGGLGQNKLYIILTLKMVEIQNFEEF